MRTGSHASSESEGHASCLQRGGGGGGGSGAQRWQGGANLGFCDAQILTLRAFMHLHAALAV